MRVHFNLTSERQPPDTVHPQRDRLSAGRSEAIAVAMRRDCSEAESLVTGVPDPSAVVTPLPPATGRALACPDTDEHPR